jgi:branched-chain amino acid aminotransferase
MISTAPSLEIEIIPTASSRLPQVNFKELGFGKIFSDHMLVAEYKQGAWQKPQILPYGDIPMSPAMATLHYAQAIFEGLKCFYNKKGELVVFRPEENYNRLIRSSERLCIPILPKEIFMQGLHQLIQLDRNWVPKEAGSSLYIRPFIFASEAFLGVRPAEEYKFIIITSPVGAYYSEPVKVKIENYYTRAASGGVGNAKTSGNYAASLYPAQMARKEGYHQLVWTDAKTHEFIEESGTMNIMFVIDDVLITPPVGDSILDGITRKSLLVLAQDLGIKVEERPISVAEIIEAIASHRLQEVFGVGTAAVISQIVLMHYNGTDYQMPALETRKVSAALLAQLQGIRSGELPDIHQWLYKI